MFSWCEWGWMHKKIPNFPLYVVIFYRAFQHSSIWIVFFKSNSVNIIYEGEDNTPSTKSLVSFPIVFAFPPFSRLSL